MSKAMVFGLATAVLVLLDINVSGLSPADYAVTQDGLNAELTTEYQETQQAHIHYQTTQEQLIPEDTVVKTTAIVIGALSSIID